MNILLACPFRLDSTGGVCTAVRTLYQEFTSCGHKVLVFVPGETDNLAKDPHYPGIPTYSIYLRTPIIERARIKAALSFLLSLPLTVLRLRSFVKRNRVDVVAIQYPMPWMVYFGLLRMLYRSRLVVSFQGNDAHDIQLLGSVERMMLKVLLSCADCVTGVARTLIQKVSTSFPKMTVPLMVIPNGAPRVIDLEDVGKMTLRDSEYLLTVGQLIHRKGIDLLIRALKLAADSGYRPRLLVIGEGEEKEALACLAEECGLQDQVFFLGNHSHQETLGHMKGCSAFVLASRAEGLPLVILEAMACGRPVIATAIDGVPDLIRHRFNGMLVKAEDPGALAEALVEVLSHPELRKELGGNGLQMATTDYAWKNIAAQYLSVFAGTGAN